jgi:hypothetical protein
MEIYQDLITLVKVSREFFKVRRSEPVLPVSKIFSGTLETHSRFTALSVCKAMQGSRSSWKTSSATEKNRS